MLDISFDDGYCYPCDCNKKLEFATSRKMWDCENWNILELTDIASGRRQQAPPPAYSIGSREEGAKILPVNQIDSDLLHEQNLQYPISGSAFFWLWLLTGGSSAGVKAEASQDCGVN